MAAPKKKAPTKAKATKTAATRKTTKKAAPKRAKKQTMRSFQRAEPTVPFLTFRFTTQTFYWIILSGLVLALGLWVMTLNIRLQKLYDQVEMNSIYSDSSMYMTPKEQKAE